MKIIIHFVGALLLTFTSSCSSFFEGFADISQAAQDRSAGGSSLSSYPPIRTIQRRPIPQSKELRDSGNEARIVSRYQEDSMKKSSNQYGSEFSSRKFCPRCNGRGSCFLCDGSGKMPGSNTMWCRVCGGKGRCGTCKGTGRVDKGVF